MQSEAVYKHLKQQLEETKETLKSTSAMHAQAVQENAFLKEQIKAQAQIIETQAKMIQVHV